jgi:Periplasmic binding protein
MAQKKYDTGASDTEIEIGGSGPFSGPASVAGQAVKSFGAYFAMVNAKGGINGRKVTYLAEDDTYSPAKAVEVTASWSSRMGCCSWRARSARRRSSPSRALAIAGYDSADTLAHILTECGDNLTRENIMQHAANLKAFHPPMMLPGISVTTTPTDYHVIHQMQFERFNGTNWELYGSVVSD